MNKILLIALSLTFGFVSVANARWVCTVANKKGQHWRFAAPTEVAAQAMAKNHCDAASNNPANCNPSCSEAGGSAWRCDVANKKGQHWTWTAPTQAAAYAGAKNHCDAASNNPANCQPYCSPE
jgi:hypothetical protein